MVKPLIVFITEWMVLDYAFSHSHVLATFLVINGVFLVLGAVALWAELANREGKRNTPVKKLIRSWEKETGTDQPKLFSPLDPELTNE